VSTPSDQIDYAALARELFQQHLDLSPLRGRDHGLVRCIFHTDRTPSLNVNLRTGLFNCFGCGAHGGAVDFARRVGAQLPERPAPMRQPRRLTELDKARREVLRLGRQQVARMASYRALFAAADEEREAMRVVEQARRFATKLGPDDPRTWDLLADAADLERRINNECGSVFGQVWR
jgi:hypothetical protein